MAEKIEKEIIPHAEYAQLVESTAVANAKMILAKVDEFKDSLVVENYSTLAPEAQKMFAEKSTDFAISVMKEIATSGTPYMYATKSIEKIIAVMETLRAFMNGTIGQYEDELMCRAIGVKSPESGKYRKEDATLTDLMVKLEEVRNTQGNVKEDFFNTEATAESAQTIVGGVA